MPPIDSVRAHIHENFYAYSPPIPDQDLDITVQALDEAIDAIWDWVAARWTQLSNALPETFRLRTNNEQKFLLLCLMASERAGGLIVIDPPVEGV